MTDPLIDALVNALADRIMQRLLDDDGPLVTKMRDVFIDGLRSHELADRDDIDNAVNKALEEHERDVVIHRGRVVAHAGEDLRDLAVTSDALLDVFDRLELDLDPGGMAGDRLVHGIVEQFGHQVVHGPLVGAADIHAGAAAHRLQPLQHLDRGGVIIAGGCGGSGREKII